MSHAPKQRALEAYAAGRLSPAGTQRVERHLRGCAICPRTLEAIRVYHMLQRDAAQQPTHELSWERLAQALTQQTSAEASTRAKARRSARVVALAWPLLAVAATVLVAWLGLHGPADESASTLPAPQPTLPTPPPAREARSAMATLIAGEAFVEHAGRRTSVGLDTALPEGSLLTTHDAVLHVRIAPGTGFVLHPESALRLVALQRDTVQLRLEHGGITSEVAALAPDQSYAVHGQTLQAHVHGTRFFVTQTAGVFRVLVHEGSVEVNQGARSLARVSPGEAFAQPEPTQRDEVRAPEGNVHALDSSLEGWATVELPATRAIAAWLIEGARLPTHAPLALRAPLGPLRLSLEDAHGKLRSITIDVVASGVTLAEAELTALLAPKEPKRGYLAPALIRQTLARALPGLRRCYEHSLRVDPSLEGKLMLSVRVAPDGRVVQAESLQRGVSGQLLEPPELARCLAHETRKLLFPKPEGGGYVSFEVPLSLRTAQ